MNKGIKIFAASVLSLALLCGFKKGKEETKWYKGNTHSHSTISDGDNPPFKVIKEYHDHGYNFLLLTDHNFLVDPDTIKKPSPLRKDFILIPGEEITDQKAVHTTAFNISEYVPHSKDPKQKTDDEKIPDEIITSQKNSVNLNATELLQFHVDGIIKAGGIPILNHPNFAEGLQVDDIIPVKNLHHIELYNGHPGVANWGKTGHISVEAKWDSILSRGQLMYAVSSDDMHHLETKLQKDANPFRGWIMVRSNELTPNSIHKSVANGDFYATNSVILKTCEISEKKCVIEIDEKATFRELSHSFGVPRIDETGNEGFLIEFIGDGGKVIWKTTGLKAEYKPKRNDKYVRVRITYCVKTDKGFEKLFAWTQPVFVD